MHTWYIIGDICDMKIIEENIIRIAAFLGMFEQTNLGLLSRIYIERCSANFLIKRLLNVNSTRLEA